MAGIQVGKLPNYYDVFIDFKSLHEEALARKCIRAAIDPMPIVADSMKDLTCPVIAYLIYALRLGGGFASIPRWHYNEGLIQEDFEYPLASFALVDMRTLPGKQRKVSLSGPKKPTVFDVIDSTR